MARASSDSRRLLLRAALRSRVKELFTSSWRRSAMTPLACSMMMRLLSAVCNCSARASRWSMGAGLEEGYGRHVGQRLSQVEGPVGQRARLSGEQVERANDVGA